MTPKITLSVEIQENLYKALEEMSKESGKSIEVLVEEAMSTLIIDNGGKFNQTSLSNALKKSSIALITKLTE